MSLTIKHRYFNGKKYVPSDSTARQEAAEEAIGRHMVKRGTYGLLATPVVTAPGPAFQYQISSGGSEVLAGHTKDGLYVELDAEPYLTGDLTGEFTHPASGKEKIITLVLRYVEEDSQPGVDKATFTTVNFLRTSSFEVGIVEGDDANPGLAVAPDLSAEDGLYLADILVEYADADATDTDVTVDSTRLKIDPLKEAYDRGMDGIASTFVLSPELAAAVAAIIPTVSVLANIVKGSGTGSLATPVDIPDDVRSLLVFNMVEAGAVGASINPAVGITFIDLETGNATGFLCGNTANIGIFSSTGWSGGAGGIIGSYSTNVGATISVSSWTPGDDTITFNYQVTLACSGLGILVLGLK